METLDCIATRRSVRKYKSEDICMDDVGKIIYAGHQAPSAGNLQNWKFIIVKKQETRTAIAEACYKQLWMCDAPVHIVVCANTEEVEQYYGVRGERLYSIQNCAAAVENMLIAATDIGLGSCWVGAFEEEALRGVVGIPDSIRPQAVITIGFAAEKPKAPPWTCDIDSVCFLESYGSRVKSINKVLGYHSEKIHDGVEACRKAAKGVPQFLKKTVDSTKKAIDKAKDSVKKE
ncbi:MAG: nitroreductase family protein [Candidatus Woesearchaeota archaeon]